MVRRSRNPGRRFGFLKPIKIINGRATAKKWRPRMDGENSLGLTCRQVLVRRSSRQAHERFQPCPEDAPCPSDHLRVGQAVRIPRHIDGNRRQKMEAQEPSRHSAVNSGAGILFLDKSLSQHLEKTKFHQRPATSRALPRQRVGVEKCRAYAVECLRITQAKSPSPT